MSFYFRIIFSIIGSNAIALRTYQEVERPYYDYVRHQIGKPFQLTGPVLPETPVTQLEEKWTNWLCNFEQGAVVYCAFGLAATNIDIGASIYWLFRDPLWIWVHVGVSL